MTEHKFGRLIEFDERSRAYPIRALIAKDAKPRSYTWNCPIVLGQIGNSCTGNAVAHEAAARPVLVLGITEQIALEVYHRAQDLDPFPGNADEGSTVLAAMKAAKERNWYKEYRWAFSEEDLCLAVGHHGPAVIGIPWYEGMMTPDKNGIIHVTGKILGGHAILDNGINIRTALHRLHQSWGLPFGINGECFISRADMARLLSEQGEACIPVLRTLK